MFGNHVNVKRKNKSKEMPNKKFKKEEAENFVISNIPEWVTNLDVETFFLSKGIQVSNYRVNYENQKIYFDVDPSIRDSALALDKSNWCGQTLDVKMYDKLLYQSSLKINNDFRERDKDSRTLIVKNLPFSANEEQIKVLLKGVVEARILTEIGTGRSKGIAFVEFQTYEAMEKAYNLREDLMLDGRFLFLDFCRNQTNYLEEDNNCRFDNETGGSNFRKLTRFNAGKKGNEMGRRRKKRGGKSRGFRGKF